MTDKPEYENYLWEGLPSDIEDGPYRQRIQGFLDCINWVALCHYASKLHNDENCTINPRFTMGGRHIVRQIDFRRGTRWIARLRMTTPTNEDEGSRLLQREVDCILLVKERTSVPVPTVYGYIASAKNDIGAPFMLMECLSGNAGFNLSGVEILAQYKSAFHKEMAKLQVRMFDILAARPALIVIRQKFLR